MSPGPLIKRRPLSELWGGGVRGGFAGSFHCRRTILITEYAVDDGDDVVSCSRHEAHQTSHTNKAVNSLATVIRSTNIDINIDINMH